MPRNVGFENKINVGFGKDLRTARQLANGCEILCEIRR